MLMKVVFILLPATALAVCEKGVYYEIFKAVDKLPLDKRVSRTEDFAVFTLFDVNLDDEITLAELEARTVLFAQALIGHEQKVLDFINQNNDTVIGKDDVEIEFQNTDTDCDGYKSIKEFAIYVDKYCTELEEKQAKASGDDDNNSDSGDAEKK